MHYCNRYSIGKQLKAPKIACLLITLLTVAEVLPQDSSDFDLFESVENSDSGADRNASRSRQTQNTPTSSEPTFMLVGTSRVGDSTAVVLRHSSGEQVRVEYAGRPTQIAGYEGFFVSRVAGRSVSIRHPSNSPCVAIEDKGVDCDQADNTSHIRLTTATAISAESEALRDAPALPDEPPAENRANPFDAIRRSAENGIPAPSRRDSQGFRPRRIDPADVPPGMRVVSTPFGDRLVEI